jgi:hypothetical protein
MTVNVYIKSMHIDTEDKADPLSTTVVLQILGYSALSKVTLLNPVKLLTLMKGQI